MLVLTRKRLQSIKAGDVLIHVVRIGPNSVRIGIDAPDHVEIVRTEIAGRAPASREAQRRKPAEAAA